MSLGKRNREAGHSFERYCSKKFHESGFRHVVTTRSESRSRDAKKIDLMNMEEAVNGQLPFAIQCKSYSTKVDYPKLLTEIQSDKMKIVLHRFTQKANTKFMNRGEYAIMNLEDFFTIIKILNENISK